VELKQCKRCGSHNFRIELVEIIRLSDGCGMIGWYNDGPRRYADTEPEDVERPGPHFKVICERCEKSFYNGTELQVCAYKTEGKE
jgi:ribosomal protein L37E